MLYNNKDFIHIHFIINPNKGGRPINKKINIIKLN